MFRRSRTSVAWMARAANFESSKGVVNTPIVAAGPSASLRSNPDDLEEWELPCSDGESVRRDEAHRMEPIACRPTVKCGTTGCTRVLSDICGGTWVYSGEGASTRAGFVGRPIGFLGTLCLVNSRNLLAMVRKKSYWTPHRALGSSASRVFSPLDLTKQVNTP